VFGYGSGSSVAMDWQVQRDFFISYTQADHAWAEWLAWELEAAGYRTMLQAWDMPPGTAFAHAMDQALQTCRRIILVLSPSYLRSAMGEAEWRAGFVDDPSGEQRRLLPVRVERCEPKGLLADRVWIDLAGVDEATARMLLREGVANALRGHGRPDARPQFPRSPPPAAVDRPRFPTALPPVWNVPFLRNPTFTGRDEVIIEVADRLRRGRAVAVSQVLQGGGGVGKTAVAVEYAWRYRARFQVVWWVRAQEPATLVGDYADLAAALGLNEAAQADQQLAATLVRNWLEGHDRWLLVLDNAEAPDGPSGLAPPLARVIDVLPRVGQGQVLVTSRDVTWDRYAVLTDLEVFTPAEATTFLLARSGSADEQTAAEIAELLGFLPLALEQAGAYVHETRIGLAAYLERLRRFPSVTLEKGQARDRDPADTLTTTWRVSLDRVRPAPGAVALLEVCAFLGSEEVPRELFAQPLHPSTEDIQVLATDPFALDNAVAALHRFGLVKATTETLTLHRLLQQVVRNHLDPGIAAARARVAVRLLTAKFPSGSSIAPRFWPVCAALLPHALAATMYAEQYEVGPAETSDLPENVADYLHVRARYAESRALLERALGIREAMVGSAHPTTAQSLTNLAKALHDQGDLDSARTLHERALGIREARLGVDHPDTALSLSNLAIVLHAQGDLDRARILHERALAIYEAHTGGTTSTPP
jgi:hypothetical protein